MKKIVLVLTIALLGTIVTNAQPPRRHGHGHGHGMNVEQRVERLAQALELTEAQKAEVTKIYTQEAEAMSKDRPAEGMMDKQQRPDEAQMKAFREKMEARRAAVDAQIEALLTPEQASKYAQLKEHKGKRGGFKHRGDKPGEKSDCRCCGGHGQPCEKQ